MTQPHDNGNAGEKTTAPDITDRPRRTDGRMDRGPGGEAGAVTRLRQKPILLVAGLVAAVVVLTFAFALRPSDRSRGSQSPVEIKLGGDAEPARGGLPRGMFDATYEGQHRPPPNEAGLSTHVWPAAPQVVVEAGPAASGVDANAAQLRAAALAELEQQRLALQEQADGLKALHGQMLEAQRRQTEAAVASPISFVNYARRQPPDLDRINALEATAPPGLGAAREVVVKAGCDDEIHPNEVLPPDVRQNLQTEKNDFLRSTKTDFTTYQSTGVTPRLSSFDLAAGTFIPGALVTGINTDLPGSIVGRITDNVYDSATGKFLLIPQGSTVVGEYQSLVSNGQNRVLIVWSTLTMPNGTSIALGRAPGTDDSGYAGLKDHVDFHFDQLAAAVAVTAGLTYAGSQVETSSEDDISIIGDVLARETTQIGNRVIDRALDRQPTITVRPGWTFRILMRKNVALAPYKE